jgi:uncharacterized protein YndB with AHSA1/START domain
MKRTAILPAILAGACLLPVASAGAAVADVSANGFLIRHEVQLQLTPEQTYELLVQRVGEWWNSDHTYSGNARNLSIDARPGGCFCEKLPNGGVQHLMVVYAQPGKVLRLSGALGPMQGSGLAGSMTWQITPIKEGGSKLSLSYSVGGYMQGGFAQMAPAADGMLGEQIGRLQKLANTGKPD